MDSTLRQAAYLVNRRVLAVNLEHLVIHDTEHNTFDGRRRPLPSEIICLVVGALALMIAVVTGFFAAGDSVLPGDVWMARTVQKTDGPVMQTLADIGNTVGITAWVATAMTLAIVVAAVLRAWTEVVFLTTLLVLRLAAAPLKALFESPRPTDDVVEIIGAFDNYGFPSGHSLTGATLCLGMAVLAWRRIPSRQLAIVAVALLIGLMMLVGWARVWVGAHWPSDVIGGFAFGVVIVAIAMVVTDRLAGRRWPS